MDGSSPTAGMPQPPPGDLDLSTTFGYRGNQQLILDAILIALSTIFVALRLYARCFMIRRPGIDDIIAVLALGALVALSAMEMHLVQFGSEAKIQYVSTTQLVGFLNALATQNYCISGVSA